MKLITVLLATLVMCCLSGCATLENAPATSKLVVQVATMKVIEARDDRHARAAKIIEITTEAKTWLDAEGVTIGALKDKVTARVMALNLSPSDKLLASALIDAVMTDLTAKVGIGLIPADKAVTVNQVLSWITDAAKFY